MADEPQNEGPKDSDKPVGRKSKPSYYRQSPDVPTAWDLAKAGLTPEEITKFLEDFKLGKPTELPGFDWDRVYPTIPHTEYEVIRKFDAPPPPDAETIRETVSDALAKALNRPQTWWEIVFSPPSAAGLAVVLYLWHPGIATVIIGCLIVLATWGYTISRLPWIVDRIGLRIAAVAVLAFGLALFGNRVANSLAQDEPLVKPTPTPSTAAYTGLSITCGPGLITKRDAEVFPYVLDPGHIALGIGGFGISPNEFATCLIRNEGDNAVDDVGLRFAYQAFYALSARPGKQPPLPMHFVYLVVPHVGLQGTYITIQNRILGAIVSLFPTYSCNLLNPRLQSRQPCSLPPGAYASGPYVQGPAMMLPPMPRKATTPSSK